MTFHSVLPHRVGYTRGRWLPTTIMSNATLMRKKRMSYTQSGTLDLRLKNALSAMASARQTKPVMEQSEGDIEERSLVEASGRS